MTGCSKQAFSGFVDVVAIRSIYCVTIISSKGANKPARKGTIIPSHNVYKAGHGRNCIRLYARFLFHGDTCVQYVIRQPMAHLAQRVIKHVLTKYKVYSWQVYFSYASPRSCFVHTRSTRTISRSTAVRLCTTTAVYVFLYEVYPSNAVFRSKDTLIN